MEAGPRAPLQWQEAGVEALAYLVHLFASGSDGSEAQTLLVFSRAPAARRRAPYREWEVLRDSLPTLSFPPGGRRMAEFFFLSWPCFRRAAEILPMAANRTASVSPRRGGRSPAALGADGAPARAGAGPPSWRSPWPRRGFRRRRCAATPAPAQDARVSWAGRVPRVPRAAASATFWYRLLRDMGQSPFGRPERGHRARPGGGGPTRCGASTTTTRPTGSRRRWPWGCPATVLKYSKLAWKPRRRRR